MSSLNISEMVLAFIRANYLNALDKKRNKVFASLETIRWITNHADAEDGEKSEIVNMEANL